MNDLTCVIGTNSWGSPLYEKALRGSSVSDDVVESTVATASSLGLDVFDTADDYGLGYAQKLLGRLGRTHDFRISAKYTPMGRYKTGQVHRAFEKQCRDLGVDRVDYYWLHLPNDVDQNLAEIVDLCKHGRIGRVGVSNFNLEEAKHARGFLEKQGVPLYGVQNHFSLLDREEEENGMLAWCQENGMAFWGWAALEEGILTGEPKGPLGVVLGRKTRKLQPLFQTMRKVGEAHGLTVAQVAVSYCVAKGVVPIVGCRKPYQVEQLAQDAATVLSDAEVAELETAADRTGVRVLKSDEFRFAVHKPRGAKRPASEAVPVSPVAIGAAAVAVAAGAFAVWKLLARRE